MGRNVFIGVPKIGNQRLKAGSLAEYRRCDDCKKAFWAESEYEQGNFKFYCVRCEAKQLVAEQAELVRKKEKAAEEWEVRRKQYRAYFKKLRANLGDSGEYPFEKFLEEQHLRDAKT